MKKILFVEDEQALQKTLSRALADAGFEVRSAVDGDDGLKQARSESPDLILLDLILPKRSGFELLKALKADAHTESIPVIVLTNLENIEDIDNALSAGAVSYLVKANYDVQDLITKVRDTLGQRA